MSYPATGYPWAREITFALKLYFRNARAHNYVERSPQTWAELQNALAAKLIAIERSHPLIVRSKWVTTGPLDCYVVQTCRNHLVDITWRVKANPLDESDSLDETYLDENGEEVPKIDLPDPDPVNLPDSATNHDRFIWLAALRSLPYKYRRALEEHMYDWSDTSDLTPASQRKRLSRARMKLVTSYERIKAGVELSAGPFYAVNPMLEKWHEMVMAERASGRNFAPEQPQQCPARCPHGCIGDGYCCHVCRYSRPGVDIAVDANYIPGHASPECKFCKRKHDRRNISTLPVTNTAPAPLIVIRGEQSPILSLVG